MSDSNFPPPPPSPLDPQPEETPAEDLSKISEAELFPEAVEAIDEAPTASPVRCTRCGYDLTGVPIGSLCPECGAAVNPAFRNTSPTSGKAIASMVLGIVSIPTCACYGVPAMVCGVLAIYYSRAAQKDIVPGSPSGGSQGMAKAGLICGIIGLSLGLLYAGFMAVIIGIAIFSHP